MKKVLLTSSALAATFAMTAPAMAAEDGLTWNAFTRFFATQANVDGGSNDDSLGDFSTNSEIHLNYQTTADNGLTYGFKIELETDQGNNNNVDENYIFVSGDFGKIELGDDDAASEDFDINGTSGFTFGQLNNATGAAPDEDFLSLLGDNTVASIGVRTSTELAIDSSDDTKISYFTPSFGGFSAGVSYVPNDSQGQDLSDDGDFEDLFALGLGYDHSFDSADLAVGFSAVTATVNDGTVQDETYVGLSLGAEVGVAGFTFSANVSNNDVDNVGDVLTYAAAVSYSFGAFTANVGGLYSESDFDDGIAVDEEFTAATAGLTYNIAPGLQAFVAGTAGTLEEDGNQPDEDLLSVTTGVQVSF
ncbi:porin [Kiloniella sp. b19]|uniref:porin n=1 Tax=Kiloniella sp. GXU_MW_B19 TaxID=3141326 RepID=UPI0031D63221